MGTADHAVFKCLNLVSFPTFRPAAKVVIKIMLQMFKRPIAHWDPALYCAHVMMYHRAPLHTDEKQTQIVLRDIMDNVSAGPGALLSTP